MKCEVPSGTWLTQLKEFDVRLYTDSSDYGLGGHLTQREILTDDGRGNCTYGEELTVMFVSHAYKNNEIAWPIADKEMYAIVFCVEKLAYLIDQLPITVLTDHANLTRLREVKISAFNYGNKNCYDNPSLMNSFQDAIIFMQMH